MTDRESKIKNIKVKVLVEQRNYLCKYLGDPSRYYPFLRAKGIINADSVQKMNAKVTNAEKVHLLIDELLSHNEGRFQECPLDILVDGIYREGVQNHIATVLLKAFLKKCTEGDLLYKESDGPLPPIEGSNILAEKLSTILANYEDISFNGFRIGKLIFYGTPRAGKTTLRKNLVKNAEGMLCSSDAPEPSTYIAEISDPILLEQVEEKDESVQRILAKNEENNEWKWTVQGLDDVAKILLQSLDIKLSNNEAKQQKVPNSRSEGLLHNPSNVTTGYENLEQPVQAAITTSTSGSAKAFVDTDVEQPKHQVSTLPIAIEKQNEQSSSSKVDIKQCFLDAIKTGRWSEVVSALNILDKSMLLQVIDGGGQPSFQEIFPLLIGCPAVKLLIFKLTDEFQTPYPAEYQPKQGRAQTWHDSGYVVRDFIFQAISSLPDLPLTANPTKIQYDPKLLLVGTHKDKLEGSEEMKGREIQKYAESIHDLLCQSKEFESKAFNWIKGKNMGDFIVGVSNTNQKDIMEIKKKIEQLISKIEPIGIPASWLVFDFVLHKYAKSKQLHKVEREMCNEITKVCHLKDDEIEYVLYFLHNKAGTILYYYDIPELKNWIITDFQLIIDSISEVIIQYFDDNGNIGRMGQVKIETLRTNDGYLEVNQLLSLMKHRHIISYKEKATTFFMPSLLPKTEGIPVSSQSLGSLLVIFDSGYSPIGLFCAVSTHLIDSHNWEINTTVSQCRNNMSFYYVWSGAQYGIVFTAFTTYYEVYLSSNVEYPPKMKFDIYKAIQASFTTVCKDIDLIPPSYGFYCTCKGAGCPQHAHPAKVGDGYEKMECCYSGVHGELTEQQKTWFQQYTKSELAARDVHALLCTFVDLNVAMELRPYSEGQGRREGVGMFCTRLYHRSPCHYHWSSCPCH